MIAPGESVTLTNDGGAVRGIQEIASDLLDFEIEFVVRFAVGLSFQRSRVDGQSCLSICSVKFLPWGHIGMNPEGISVLARGQNAVLRRLDTLH